MILPRCDECGYAVYEDEDAWTLLDGAAVIHERCLEDLDPEARPTLYAGDYSAIEEETLRHRISGPVTFGFPKYERSVRDA